MPHKSGYQNKLLLELSINARAKRKDLSQRLKISPQLVSYSTNMLETNKLLMSYNVQIDPAKFGLMNIMVALVYTTFEKQKKREIIDFLKNDEHITFIEELTQNADLCMEYTIPNLSFFNKLHMDFMEKFGKDIKVVGMFPVIVKHTYPKRYLNKRSKYTEDRVLSGDRATVSLNHNSQKVLSALIENPTQKAVALAKKTGLNIRTVIKTKKYLEIKDIIRGYGTILNNIKLNIHACNLFINFTYIKPKEINRLIQYAKVTSEIVSVTKIIGRYNLWIRIEGLEGYKETLNELRKEFGFYDYSVFDCGQTLKNTYIPKSVLLETF